jgi:hypothetical protein
MADEIQYHDVYGNPCSLPTLCRRDPGWAANRIRHMTEQLSQAQAEIAALKAVVEAADRMRKELLAWTTEAEEVPAFDAARAKLKDGGERL